MMLFADLKLSAPLLKALNDVGYETPSPIQAATIPALLENKDILGQAQTGTGKTAAFALPILSRLDLRQTAPQALVLAPTRELAIQVAEAFQTYAAHIPGFHVLPIYGGQSYGPQLSALRRGVHVVVGTPGRVIDHLEKGSLDLSQVKTLVLDEADEMLRMGFIDDVETILQKTPASRQTALFSATMPPVIKRIAKTYLRDAIEITVAAKTGTADNIRQRYWMVSGMNKLDALTRILEAEPFDGMIIFARTKLGTEELASKLQARGFSAAAINGDLAQVQRERTISQLKDGKIDILVATDVAARGLDVDRISHVINFDVPHDPESYTHRIGRTGRAGRSGDAILFITPREKGLLKMIERATRQPVEALTLPTVQAVNDVRIAKFKDQISETLADGKLGIFISLIEDFEREKNIPVLEIAAALAKMARGEVPLLLDKNQREPAMESESKPMRTSPRFDAAPARPSSHERSRPRSTENGMATWRIAVGHSHGVKPGNIVGAIANEAGMDAKNIGRIEIFDDYSLLDMPDDIAPDLLAHLKNVWVAGQQLQIVRDGAPAESTKTSPKEPTKAPTKAPAKASPPKPEASTIPPSVATQAAVPPNPPPIKKAAKEPLPMPEIVAALPVTPPVVAAQPKKTARVKAADLPDKFDRPSPAKKEREVRSADFPMRAYRIEVGNVHGVKAANIVGAIANEAGLDARHIGRIEIFDAHSTLDLPDGMPKELMEHLKKVVVAGQAIKISVLGKTAEKTLDKLADKLADKLTDKLTDKPANKSVDKPIFGPRISGADRRVAEKSAGAGKKPPVRPTLSAPAAAGTAKKPHRKGGKAV